MWEFPSTFKPQFTLQLACKSHRNSNSFLCNSMQCDLSPLILNGLKLHCTASKKCRHLFWCRTTTAYLGHFVPCNPVQAKCVCDPFGVWNKGLVSFFNLTNYETLKLHIGNHSGLQTQCNCNSHGLLHFPHHICEPRLRVPQRVIKMWGQKVSRPWLPYLSVFCNSV